MDTGTSAPTTTDVSAEWVRSVAKAEVHVHLEAALPREEFVRMAEDVGEPVPEPYKNLPELLAYLDWTCSLVRQASQLDEIAYSFSRRKHGSGVRWADLIFNPTHWTPWHGRLGEMIEALDAGFTRAESEGLTQVGLCPSILRQQTREQALELVDALIELDHPRVVALSIDGNEAAAGRTGERFAPAFARAREAGLGTTAHAGESSGPEGVRDALDLLGVERIEHGVRAIAEPALVDELARRQVALGVTPLANNELGMWPGVEDHPVDRLRRAGVRLSINTDDPVAPQFSLEDNYALCAEAFGWGRDDVLEMIGCGVAACFAPDDTKTQILHDLEGETD